MSIGKKVLIGIPIKNCGEWIENTVRQLININYNRELISIVFIENDSIDYSYPAVKYCIDHLLSKYKYNFIELKKMDMGFHLPHYSRHDFRYMEKRMLSLKTIRNYIVDTYLKDNNYIWWVDADYKTIPLDILSDAVNSGYDMIMPRVEVNGSNYDGMTHGIYNGEIKNIKAISELETNTQYYEMRVIECAAIISRKVFDSGIRYGYGPEIINGEERYLQEGPFVSFAAKQKGFSLVGDLKNIIVHQDVCGSIPFDP